MKSRSKKFNSLFNKLLNNKIVLYVVALIALIDVIAYIINKEFGAVLFFYLAGLIAYKFSSNMTVVLGSALIATSLVHLLKFMLGFKEGFVKENLNKIKEETFKEGKNHIKENKEEEEEKDKEEEKEKEEEEEEEEEESTPLSKIPLPKVPLPKDISEKNGFTNQKLSPEVINNIPNKDKLTQNMSKADNIEAAYDNLEKTIGENGIKSMSGATKDLISQQNQLVKGLKEVTPVLNEAMGALAKIDLSSLSGMFNKFSSQV